MCDITREMKPRWRYGRYEDMRSENELDNCLVNCNNIVVLKSKWVIIFCLVIFLQVRKSLNWFGTISLFHLRKIALAIENYFQLKY